MFKKWHNNCGYFKLLNYIANYCYSKGNHHTSIFYWDFMRKKLVSNDHQGDQKIYFLGAISCNLATSYLQVQNYREAYKIVQDFNK